MVIKAVCANQDCGHLMSAHSNPFDEDRINCTRLGCRCPGGFPPLPEPKQESASDRIYRFVEHLERMTKVVVCNAADAPRITAAVESSPAPGLFKIVVSDSVQPGKLVIVDKSLAVLDWADNEPTLEGLR